MGYPEKITIMQGQKMRAVIFSIFLTLAFSNDVIAQSMLSQKPGPSPTIILNNNTSNHHYKYTKTATAKPSQSTEKNHIPESSTKNSTDILITDYTGKIARYTKWLVMATIALGIVGFFQFIIGIIQGILFFLQIKLARKEFILARKGFGLARKEFIASHRPKLRIQEILVEKPPVWNQTSKGEIIMLNFGDTEAIIVNFVIDVFSRQIGKKANYDIRSINVPVGLTPIQSGTMFTLPFESAHPIQHGTAEGIEHCVVGRINYRDKNNNTKIIGFFRVYDHKTERFVPAPKEHEYAELEFNP